VEATGVIVGEFEIINLESGKRYKVEKDGSELRDEVIPPAIEWCDKGQHFAPKLGGRDDYGILWICLACQS
jgi:hypothetical protein|tara:strand:- start:244 stop:456 length:213 start_codon:yes stop_codon:yes gene_type:complete